MVEAASLEASQARLDRALSNLIWVKMSLLVAGGVALDGLHWAVTLCVIYNWTKPSCFLT